MADVEPGAEPLRPLGGFMLDVDGTLVLSDRSLKSYDVLPGAREVLSALKRSGMPYVLLTNGSAYPPPQNAAKLRAVGLEVEDEQMLTPSSVCAHYLAGRGCERALILGSPGVGWCLAEAGIETVFPGDAGAADVQAVYVGWHPDCTMGHIEAACTAIWNGAELVVASDVPFFATRSGKTIGYSHAIVAAIRSLTNAPKTITGKPSVMALRYVASRLGMPMSRIGVIGDDPLVEMIMARKGGAYGFGVTTGVTSREEWIAQPTARRPHRVLDGVGELLTLGLFGQDSRAA